MEKEKNNLFFSTFLENIKSCTKIFLIFYFGYMALLNHFYGCLGSVYFVEIEIFCC